MLTLQVPLTFKFDESFFTIIPVDKDKCSRINPIVDIQFQLYTEFNPSRAQILTIGDDKALIDSYIDFRHPTVVIFHAFFEDSGAGNTLELQRGYIKKGGHNIIVLNAPRLTAGPWYNVAARNTRVVGEYTALFIDYLVTRGLNLKRLHLIGLSLGAQMAGVTGSAIRHGRPARITGMDPARPLFQHMPARLRLDRDDADFVDIIHSDAGVFGYERPMGHADFWPNGGRNFQPGCYYDNVRARNPYGLFEKVFCSHWRALQYYAESINKPRGFLAVQCRSWAEFTARRCNDSSPVVPMGHYVPETTRGNFYLATNAETPFSLT